MVNHGSRVSSSGTPYRLPASNGRSIFQLGDERVHDGHVLGCDIYFTTVNGRVLRFDLRSGKMRCFDLNKIDNTYDGRPLGWCRGILPLGQKAWIGFSRIRYTALRQNLDWIRRGFRDADRFPPAPTRVACYDLANGILLAEIDLEEVAMNTVFSIHAADR